MKFLTKQGLQRFLDRLKAIIPTKTSDIQNDSGFLDTTGVQNYMENGGGYSQSYIDTALSGKAAASHTHSKTDLTDLFSSANTWTAQNSYNSDLNLNYASTDVDDIVNSVAGSATLDNFVHQTGNETVSGIKSFPDGIVANVTGSATSATNDGSGNVITSTYGKLGAANEWSGDNTYSGNVNLYNSDNTQDTPVLVLRNSKTEVSSSENTIGHQGIYFTDKNATSLAYVRGMVQSNGCSLNLRTFAKDSNNNTVESGVQLASFIDGGKWFAPYENKQVSLGGGNYKWKSFNGLNPGRLSFPDMTSADVDIIDTQSWNVSGGYSANDGNFV